MGATYSFFSRKGGPHHHDIVNVRSDKRKATFVDVGAPKRTFRSDKRKAEFVGVCASKSICFGPTKQTDGVNGIKKCIAINTVSQAGLHSLASSEDVARLLLESLWPDVAGLQGTCKAWDAVVKKLLEERKMQALSKISFGKILTNGPNAAILDWDRDLFPTNDDLLEKTAMWAGGWLKFLHNRASPFASPSTSKDLNDNLSEFPWPCCHGEGSVLIFDIRRRGEWAGSVLMPTHDEMYTTTPNRKFARERGLAVTAPIGQEIPGYQGSRVPANIWQHIRSSNRQGVWLAGCDRNFFCSFESLGSKEEDVKEFDLFIKVVSESNQKETTIFGGLGDSFKRSEATGHLASFVVDSELQLTFRHQRWHFSDSLIGYARGLPVGYGAMDVFFNFHWGNDNTFNVALTFRDVPGFWSSNIN
ncbi:MAG: hypothetical protein SGILL_005768 [Bacillariaceae sp.]